MKPANRLNYGLIIIAIAALLAGCTTSRSSLALNGKEQQGYASWYSYPFHGKRTSNGEIYNMNALTAAHWTIPLNSIVEVTNVKNGRKVLVRINDRLPPNRKGRIIDLSKCAARELDMFSDGIVPVTLRVVVFGNNLYVRTNHAAPDGKMYLKGQEPQPTSSNRNTTSESEAS